MIPTDLQTDDPLNGDPATALLSGGVTGATLLVAFTLMAAGVEWFWVAFPLGFGVVLPTVLGLRMYARATDGRPDRPAETRTRTRTTGEEDGAIETLRRRYARGDLTEAEFERRVEPLLETEASERRHESTTTNR